MDYKKYLEENGTLKPPVGATNASMPSAEAPKSWSDQVADLYGQITNRPAFSYDPENDPLWQNYKTQYTLAGRKAMEDTMGQAAALTGGYSSSYSQAAGQQQYGDYMTRMNAELPNLYAQARQAYDKEGDDLYNRYNMAMGMEQQEYARGRDELADQRYQDELAYAREQDAYNRQQNERSEARNYATYLLQLGIMPSAEELAAAGMSQQEAAQVQNYYKLQLSGYGGSGGSGGSGGRSSGGGYRYRSTDTSPNDTPEKEQPDDDGPDGPPHSSIKPEDKNMLWSYAKEHGIKAVSRYMKKYYAGASNYDAVVDWITAMYENYRKGMTGGVGKDRNVMTYR